ncbi:MAG: fumarylacetoacetate hydrolase family protein [Mycobacterium sp.]|nr:fumarylacetoacetate hydrolase family protein [Mycobacterium sp.]
MRYAHWSVAGTTYVGLIDHGLCRPFALPADEAGQGVAAVIRRRAAGLASPDLTGKEFNVDDVDVLAPIPNPHRNIFCIVKNYWSLVHEVGGDIPKAPICYTKVPESVIGHKSAVDSHPHLTDSVDYEAELAVVIGRQGRDISEADALNHVFGYTIVNDIAARDIQYAEGQWDLSKSLDTFCPMGPVIVDRESIDLDDTSIRLWVNDELRQDGNTSDMIFSVANVIATLSAGMTLYPGDIISTGSPAGVGMCRTPPAYLKAGDTVRVSIAGIGDLINTVV